MNVKELFFNRLIKEVIRLGQTDFFYSSSFENYEDWFGHYQELFQFSEELNDEEIYAHWKKWALAFLEQLKTEESTIKFSNSVIVLYRALLVPDSSHIQFNGVGTCWSIYPHTKAVFRESAKNGATETVTLTAEVPLHCIDWEATAEFFTNLWAFKNEGEVRLLNGSEILIIKINDQESKVLATS
jgi:hypothetical protein